MITIETPGFASTPLTRAILCVSLTLSIIGKLFGIEEYLIFIPSNKFSFLRVVLSSLFLDPPFSIVSASLITYWLRTLERHIGTRKIAVLCGISWVTYAALCFLESVFVQNTSIALPPSCGIFWYMLSLTVLYARCIPDARGAKIFNREFPAKKLMYVTIVFHAAVGLPYNITGLVAGVAAGMLYTSSSLGLMSVEVPVWLADKASKWILPLFGMEKRPKNNVFHDNQTEVAEAMAMDHRPIPYEADAHQVERNDNNNNNNDGNDDDNNNNNGGNSGSNEVMAQEQALPHQGGGGENQERGYLMSFLQGVEPDPQAVEALVTMGFDENTAKEALVVTNNNVDLAASQLLDNVN